MTIERYKWDGIVFSRSIDEHPVAENFKIHVHTDYEIFCVVSGNVDYLVEGRIYELSAGSIMIMRNAETHRLLVRGDEKYERYVLNFSPDLLSKYGFDSSLLDVFTLRPLGEDNLYLPTEFSGLDPLGLFRQMSATFEISDKEEAAVAYLSALLFSINTVYYTRKELDRAVKSGFEKKIIEYVNRHLLDDITLSSISEELHMSPSQINRIFNRMTGTSVYNYVITKRLVYAQGMIQKGESAQSACQSCGFKDYSSFFRLYKKRFGHSPAKEKRIIR